MITAFHALALLIEAPLLAWADRGRVRMVSAIALVALAASLLLGALARGPAMLLCALALYGPASGCMLAASEGLLVESSPDSRERTMTRLTLAGVLGDLSVPALLALLAVAGAGWRAALVIAAVGALGLAVTHARSRELDRPMASADAEDEDAGGEAAGEGSERPPLRELARVIRATPALLGWALAGVAVNLLDEVLVAFSLVLLDARLHAGTAWCAAAVAAWTVGGIAGLLGLDRLLTRFSPLWILAVTAAVATIALLVFALAPTVLVATIALGCVGASASCFHPLAAARAYAALPGRPALVSAAASVVAPLDAVLPLALAAIATKLGARAAVLALLVAPVGLGVAALAAMRRSSR